MYALEVKNLSKSFEKVKAVDNISLEIPEGAIFGLLGRNGAGKTTTIRMLMNIYLPDSGEIILRGKNMDRSFSRISGYLPEERGLYKKMKILDTLLFFAEIKGKSGKEYEKKAMEYLERFDLAERKDSKIEDLSKGNQQKVQFITTILHDPDFLVLDEPFSGMDPINTNLLKEIILEKKKEGKVIIFSTHLMDFAEKMCDHIAIIDQGKIVLKGNLNEIKKEHSRLNVSLDYEGDISFLNDHPIIESIADFGNFTGIRVKETKNIQELAKLLVDNNVLIKKFDANDITLHEIFVELTGREIGEVANVK